MKTSIRIYLAAILVLFAVFCMLNSCQRADLDASSTQVEENKKQPKLGEKLQNPYSLSHMQTAYNNIKGRNTGETEFLSTMADYWRYQYTYPPTNPSELSIYW